MNSPQTTNVHSGTARASASAPNPIVPARREKITARIAARRSSLSLWDIYRLWNAGLLQGERPTPRKILIYADSLEAHLTATATDPDFWDSHHLAQVAR